MSAQSKSRRARCAAADAAQSGLSAARQPLSPERIRAAALELVDADGVEALSMRRLAAALGVDPMSIYHHVPNKQALLQAVYERVLEELPVPRATVGGWQHALRDLARRFYRLARRHPQVMPSLIASRYGTQREREIHAAIDRLLESEGFPAVERGRIVGAIYTYATGLAGLAAHGLGSRPLYDPRGGRAAARQGAPRSRGAEDDVDFSIGLMIAGIESLARARAVR